MSEHVNPLANLSRVEWLDRWEEFPIQEEEIVIPMMIDAHTHLRQGRRLPLLAEAQAPWCSHVLPMPNLKPPLTCGASVMEYAKEIRRCVEASGHVPYEIIPCLYLTPETTLEVIEAAAELGVKACKLYPAAVTTGSEGGVTDIEALFPVFAAMEKVGLVLCLHGETTDRAHTVLSAEQMFVARWLDKLAFAFPNLTIVLEHITSKAAVDAVEIDHQNVFASITVHHLFLVFQDVIGAYMYPDNFCKPVAKLSTDRGALVRAAISGNPKFFLGTDSAPHEHNAKYSSNCCAGVFTATVAPELLVEFFARMDAVDKLPGFTSGHAAKVYGLTQSERTLRFIRDPHAAEKTWHGHTPFWAGRELQFRLAD